MTSEHTTLEGFEDSDTDVGSDGWEQVVFSEVISINDYPPAEKGEEYRSVGMSDVARDQRKIEDWEYKEYSYSRPRFGNGQTLMARITPCLENGKTAFVDILGDDEVAVGSTEFIVLSETDRILPKFVYYTVRRPEIRQFAIKRMTGTSGRQRVPLDIFDNIKISLPPVQEQKAIVSVLDAIDSKIETNHRINEILENISFALFKSWFIDFEPYKNFKNTGDGEIPVNFKLGSINDIVDLKNGSSRPESEGQIPVYGGNGITDYTSEISESSEVVVIGRVGAFCGNVHRTYRSSWISDNAILAKSKNEKISINYIYQLMKSMNLKRLRHGTSQPLISQTDIYEEEVIIPPIDEIQESEHMTEYMFDYICKNRRENKSLRQLRDTLLPKLMSGEIRVDDIELDELGVDSEV